MSSDSSLDLSAYFARIGYDGPTEATLSVLNALHRHHVAAIPFENLDVLLGRPVRIDLDSIQRKLVHARRGGYCFEQNALFAAVLRALGFELVTLAARVRWKVPAEVATPRTHMTLLVHCAGKRYLADVGFGGLSLTAAIELDSDARQETPHTPRRLVRDGGTYQHQAWRSDDWLDVYRFTLEPHGPADYELANWYTSTHPQSRFRQNLIVARTTGDRHLSIANREFTIRRSDGAVEKRPIPNAEVLLALLDKHFGLQFSRGTRFGTGDVPWPI